MTVATIWLIFDSMMKSIHQSKGNDLSAFAAFLAVAAHRSLVATVVPAEHPEAVLEEDRARAVARAGSARPLALVDLSPRLLVDVEGPRVRLPGWVVVAVVVEVAVRDDHLTIVHDAARRVAHRGEVRAARDGQALRRGDRPCGRQRIGRHGVLMLVALAHGVAHALRALAA